MTQEIQSVPKEAKKDIARRVNRAAHVLGQIEAARQRASLQASADRMLAEGARLGDVTKWLDSVLVQGRIA